MPPLLADRFVLSGTSWIDLASGAAVRIRLAPAGDVAAQIVWSDRCATLAGLRHPLMNTLVDFGCAGRGQTFEAYSIGPPIRTSGRQGSALLTHASRFVESRGLPVTRELVAVAFRAVAAAGYGRSGTRVVGIILQPRSVLTGLVEAFQDASPAGTAIVDVAGPSGSGLRTLRWLAARAARVAGFVPVSSTLLLRGQRLQNAICDRHLCVLLDARAASDEAASTAAFLTRLGTASARRHLLLRFHRTAERLPHALHVDPLGITALTAMVYLDRDCGPAPDELFAAAREAAGRPGLFLERLHAARFGERAARACVVHESGPGYDFQPEARSAPAPARPAGRTLLDAPSRAGRLAARGRHASAARLLQRASRVLEGRRDVLLASACAYELGWICRDRGRNELAFDAFERARTLAGASPLAIQATIGVGVIWTDDRRFDEAEASLRSACSAADVIDDAATRVRAVRALARCLFRQARHEEAAIILAPCLAAPADGDLSVAAWALAARIRVAVDDLRGAVAAAAEALRRADEVRGPRALATAARSMAIVHAALGDGSQVLKWVERGLEAASAAHLPLAGLRLRAMLIRTPAAACGTDRINRILSHLRTAIAHRALPALIREELEAACAAGSSSSADGPRLGKAPESGLEAAVADLQHLLELAHGAPDDRAAVDALCEALCERLRAASVQIVGGRPDHRTLARSGRPWQGDTHLIDRALAGGTGSRADLCREPRQTAEPIRYGREPIAALCCRWTAGATLDVDRACAVLRAGALAAASATRGLLDRPATRGPEPGWGELIGQSAPASALRDAIARAARAPFPLLIEGESGSGKELVARAIHRLGARRDRRLCTLNCAALSDDLLEAELFGHARGAFTGAVGERAGLFEEADGGTLFLDEVGELSPRAQAKLLRVLQDGEVRRVGENLPRRVDARIVAATNRRLDEEAQAGRFRSDLRFRLDVIRIHVPPLRDRSTDIPALAQHFWTESTARLGSSATLAPETVASLARYDWPGNVRELQNVLASLAVHAPRRGRILPAMLPAHLARSSIPAATTFDAAREEFERRFVRAALAQAGGQRARAARALGVSRQGLAKMLRRLRIEG
jgi:DNA-binding NtrC family response regulator/tetratricopeptide (TPR) repeat protein